MSHDTRSPHELRARAYELQAEACRLLAEAERLAAGGQPLVFDQHNLPHGVTRGVFLELHRGHMKAGTAGWSARGKSRLVTAAAWEAEVEAATTTARAARAEAAPAPDNDVDDLDKRLGIRPVRRGAR